MRTILLGAFMVDPADTTITRQTAIGTLDFIRVEAKDGRKILMQLDMSMADFLAAIMGQEIVARLNRP